MTKAINLPRETNPARALSVLNRSNAKRRQASAAAKANPNAGTIERRRDRVLACWAQSRKVRFVRQYGRTDIAGAAKAGAVRKAAREYREAMKVWQGNYFRASGF